MREADDNLHNRDNEHVYLRTTHGIEACHTAQCQHCTPAAESSRWSEAIEHREL